RRGAVARGGRAPSGDRAVDRARDRALRGLALVVLNEASARLAAEQARVRHRDEARRRRHARLAQLLPERLGRVHVHVDPDEVDQFTRPHRPPGAVLHPDVQVLRRDTRFVENADAVVEERNQDAVDDEAGRVVAADRRLAETRAEGVRGRQREPTDGIVAGGLLERPLLDLAREEVRDAVASALGEVERDLAADRLDAGLDAELRDPGTHRTEPYDADPRDLPRHGGDP